LAVAAARKDLIEQRSKKQQAVAQQQRRVIGGSAQRSIKPAKTTDDVFAEWNKALREGKPLLN
jgi:hypothetical protein